MVNPLLIPSRTWSSLKRGGLVLFCGLLGPLLMEAQAADPPPGISQKAASPGQTDSSESASSPSRSSKQGKLVLVSPGTIVGDKAPEGWSHLILKSYPRVKPEHRSRVSESTARLSSLVFTSIMARVERVPDSDPARFALGDIGLGLGTKVGGKEMVLSPDTQSRLGANLGFQERIVLSETYKRQSMARAVVRTETMAVIDTHAVMIFDGKHQLAKVRYAVLLDPRSGQIATLSWGVALDQEKRPHIARTPIEWLKPNAVDDCVLHVDPNQFTLGIPNDIAFAVNRPPEGREQIPLNKELASLAGRSRYDAETAQKLETTLRSELRKVIQQAAGRETSSRIAGGSSAR